MTDKQIIIDNVDVSECQYLYFAIEDSIIDCKEYLRCSIGEAFTNNACKNSNCYYKQLKRKEQECEKRKQTLTKIKEIAKENCKLCLSVDGFKKPDDCGLCEYAKILQRISESEVNND